MSNIEKAAIAFVKAVAEDRFATPADAKRAMSAFDPERVYALQEMADAFLLACLFEEAEAEDEDEGEDEDEDEDFDDEDDDFDFDDDDDFDDEDEPVAKKAPAKKSPAKKAPAKKRSRR